MRKQTKRSEHRPQLQVPAQPVDPAKLPHGVSQDKAQKIIADVLSDAAVQWVAAPDLLEFAAYIQDLVNLAEYGNSWKADEHITLHPRGDPQSLVDDLRAIADAQIREYTVRRTKNREYIDPAVVAYLQRNPSPFTRRRGRKASSTTAMENLRLAATVKMRMDKGMSFERACEPPNPSDKGDSRAAKAYSALKDTPELKLMVALLRAGVESF